MDWNNCLTKKPSLQDQQLTIIITVAIRIRIIIVYLNYVSGHIDELIYQSLTVHFSEYATLVVVSGERKEILINF